MEAPASVMLCAGSAVIPYAAPGRTAGSAVSGVVVGRHQGVIVAPT